jgi:hypothetical protein
MKIGAFKRRSVKNLALVLGAFAVAMPISGMAQSLVPVADFAPNAPPAPPPFAGALPPDEIIASVNSAGFDPLTRPVRRGGVYVLVAADRYDMDVRVAVDAFSGRVVSATRLAGEFYDGPGDDRYEPVPRAPGYPWPRDGGPRLYGRPLMPPPDGQIYGPRLYGPGRYGPGRYEPGRYEPSRDYSGPSVEEGDIRPLRRERAHAYEAPPRRTAAALPSHPRAPRIRHDDIAAGAPKAGAPHVEPVPKAAAPASADAAANMPVLPPPGMVPVAPLE